MTSSPEAELPPLAPPTSNGGLLEVFRRRYLLRLLVRRAIDSRYQGTALGWAWSYLQPFVRFLMFYFVFQVLIGRGGSMENFAIHLVCGMVIVHFFTETFNGGTKSLVNNRGLIVKLPIPRELFPVATMLVQNHRQVIPDFYGLTTSFTRKTLKPVLEVLAVHIKLKYPIFVERLEREHRRRVALVFQNFAEAGEIFIG